MNFYKAYLEDIDYRKKQGLQPKPIDEGLLLKEIISIIKDEKSKQRKKALNFLIYNTLPGTTSAAFQKSIFLKEIILGKTSIKEITPLFALELLSHMKGGPSIKVLLDIALDKSNKFSRRAANILKMQVFLYEEDTDRLKSAYLVGNKLAKEITC